ncbi:hypothetical protein Q0S99_15270 [Stenotrophomonas indicatrix]|uniref:hypothetical protein n=1 Tax=Stenotrophomonas indicatrix TaxID=2045451 RepID=UPI002652D0A0|nr:hypothetical protein [Stenotrophomonas indicatrix]MDN8656652.1 hypothetical protein [Stenotrophomonas indicatrix]
MTHIKTRKYAPRVSVLATATLAAGFAPLAAQAADDAGARAGATNATSWIMSTCAAAGSNRPSRT